MPSNLYLSGHSDYFVSWSTIEVSQTILKQSHIKLLSGRTFPSYHWRNHVLSCWVELVMRQRMKCRELIWYFNGSSANTKHIIWNVAPCTWDRWSGDWSLPGQRGRQRRGQSTVSTVPAVLLSWGNVSQSVICLMASNRPWERGYNTAINSFNMLLYIGTNDVNTWWVSSMKSWWEGF